MNCERARELFSEYLEEGVDVALAAVVRGHLNQCADCAREFELFRQTWSVLDRLPEIEVPRSFRHDVVMRAAREQHERARIARRKALSWEAFANRFAPMRGLALAAAAAALAIILLRIPESTYVHFTGMFNPKVEIGKTVKMPSDAGTSALRTDSPRKEEWLARKIGRNSVWITMTPRDNGNGSIVYRVMLTINKFAFLPGESSNRIGAQVHLLSANQFDFGTLNGATAVWTGSILDNSPVLVPVIVDQTQGRDGTVNLLVTWTFRDRSFGHVVMIPTRKSGQMFGYPSNRSDLSPAETSVYSTLQSVAQTYGVPVVANAYMTEQPAVVSMGQGDLQTVLTQTLGPVGVDWMIADGVIYVDHVSGKQ